MTNDQQKKERIEQAAKRALAEAQVRKENALPQDLPKEINGPKGAEPTRFEDWERKGIAYDF